MRRVISHSKRFFATQQTYLSRELENYVLHLLDVDIPAYLVGSPGIPKNPTHAVITGSPTGSGGDGEERGRGKGSGMFHKFKTRNRTESRPETEWIYFNRDWPWRDFRSLTWTTRCSIVRTGNCALEVHNVWKNLVDNAPNISGPTVFMAIFTETLDVSRADTYTHTHTGTSGEKLSIALRRALLTRNRTTPGVIIIRYRRPRALNYCRSGRNL